MERMLSMEKARTLLQGAGYHRARCKGGHEVWARPGVRSVALVHHGTRDKRGYINSRAVRRALREV